MSVPTERENAPTAPSVRRRAGLRASAADMVRSLLVILAVVGLFVLLVPRPSSVPRTSVDLRAAAASARSELGFPPAVGVPAGWTVTSTRVRRDSGGLVSWSVNYLTAEGRYVGMEQAAGWNAKWQDSLTHGGLPQGTRTIAGREWVVYLKQEKEVTSLLAREPNHSTLVLAKSGGEPDARKLVESLSGL